MTITMKALALVCSTIRASANFNSLQSTFVIADTLGTSFSVRISESP